MTLDFEMTVPYLGNKTLRFSANEGAKYTFSKIDEKDDKDGLKARTVPLESLNKMLTS